MDKKLLRKHLAEAEMHLAQGLRQIANSGRS
jgi:hypothetical protein